MRVILNRLRQGGFAEGAYEVVRKNCNHFCDEFCFALLERRIPSWVNRAASLGSWAGLRGVSDCDIVSSLCFLREKYNVCDDNQDQKNTIPTIQMLRFPNTPSPAAGSC